MSLSGSDQSKSHSRPFLEVKVLLLLERDMNAPVSGTSVGRMTLRICSIDWRSGLNPPCILFAHSPRVKSDGMDARKDLFVNDGGDREAVEAICEGLPQLDVVAPFA